MNLKEGSYNPTKYWTARQHPAPNKLPSYAKTYMKTYINQSETILDYGPGDGRLYDLYKNKEVYGYDIVDRTLSITMISELTGYYDLIICSKVLLHVLPSKIAPKIRELRSMCDVMLVYDTIGPCGAPHNFAHNFSKYGIMQDIKEIGKDLLFVYDNR